MKKQTPNALIWLFIIAIFTTQCQMYHLKAVEVDDFNRFPSYKNRLSYHLIVHLNDGTAVELINAQITENRLSGTAIPVSDDIQRIYNLAQTKRNFRGRVRTNKMFLKQLHLFVSKAELQNDYLMLSFNDIHKIQALEKNKGLTTLSAVAIGYPSAFAAFMIYLFIACNCPHAYVYNGQEWEFTNSLYTGAVHPELERFDFKKLMDFKPNATSYSMQIRNELDEIQYTNQLQLLAVYHPIGTSVVADQTGKMYGYTQQIRPVSVKNDEDKNVYPQIAEVDEASYGFETIDQTHFSHLYATFQKDDWGKQPICVIRAKNTEWAGYLYHEFTSLFGNKYDNWLAANSKKTKAELDANIAKTGMLLSVDIKDGNTWKEIEQFQLVGERAYNDLAIAIPDEFLENKTIEIRLRTGFQFWQIDALYIAEASQEGLQIKTHEALGVDLNPVAALSQNDQAYFVHRQGEAPIDVSFTGLAPQNRTLFLKSKGYYRSNQTFIGKPDYQALWRVRKDGGLSLFSKSKYDEFMRINAFFAELPRE